MNVELFIVQYKIRIKVNNEIPLRQRIRHVYSCDAKFHNVLSKINAIENFPNSEAIC